MIDVDEDAGILTDEDEFRVVLVGAISEQNLTVSVTIFVMNKSLSATPGQLEHTHTHTSTTP